MTKKTLCSTPWFTRMAGFTLLEMLVVLVIIGLLVSLVGPRLFTKVDYAKVQTAQAQIKLLRGAVETMRMDINIYPSAEQGLRLLTDQPTDPALRARWRGPYLEGAVPLDPWGNPYQYSPPEATGQPFRLYSFGGDGKPGGTGTDADIGLESAQPTSSQDTVLSPGQPPAKP
jgi:general secretion pathway protein G